MFSFDIPVLKFLEGIRTDFLNNLLEFITILGEETILILIIATLWFAFDKKSALKIFFVTVLSLGTNNSIKSIAKVPRPFATGEVTCVRPETATGYAFPSGHTQTFTTWSTLAAIMWKKPWIKITAAVLIPLIGFSRIYLGAHYPSDVIVAIILGAGFAFFGNYLFDKIKDKRKLLVGVLLLYTPFAIWFMTGGDPLFEDFFKVYGMILGLTCVVFFDHRKEDIDYSVVWWKKLIRVAVGVLLALLVKESIKLLYFTDIVWVTFAMDIIRYGALVFVVLAIYPMLFKKLNF